MTVGNYIAGEIRTQGAISFARFMELALYLPSDGYYERTLSQIGRRGDYYTSVSVGPLFGELLAFQFARWLEPLRRANERMQIVEAGAHDGLLAFDVLTALRRLAPKIFQAIEYRIAERSAGAHSAQATRLREFECVRWVEKIEPGSVTGVIFSNELLDAMPVHRFAWNAAGRVWEELGVGLASNDFVWQKLRAPAADPPSLPGGLLDVLPDGYVVELSPAALAWWRSAAAGLRAGRLMAIDYGGTIEELLNPGRTNGTVRAYARHRHGASVLAHPGEQDITAHVDFTAIMTAGETSGLKTEIFSSQGQFLTGIARDLWEHTGSWPASQVRQFQTLTYPEHLGRPFRVLVQARNEARGPQS